jgi:hypothetical protein
VDFVTELLLMSSGRTVQIEKLAMQKQKFRKYAISSS